MSGWSQLWIQPSELLKAAPIAANTWYRGIPTPGASGPAIQHVPTSKNLISGSPPTLLEQYEVYSHSIQWGLRLDNSVPAPTAQVELAFLLNDRVAYTAQQTQAMRPIGGNDWLSAGSFVADLVNPIRVGARDRLSLRIGFLFDQAVGVGPGALMLIGEQFGGSSDESTISYNVLDMPASRRL